MSFGSMSIMHMKLTNAEICSYFLSMHVGQPKRHLLTTGWSVFVSAKRLVAGDSVLFIWYFKFFLSTYLSKFTLVELQLSALLFLETFP